jgi:hypothetical protein
MGEGSAGTRRSIVTTVLTFAIATIAMAAGASVSDHPAPSVAPQVTEAPERSTHDAKEMAGHGGPIARVHDVSCDLTDVGDLPRRWTHGDYVSAVARSGKVDAVRTAAQSACGMPVAASAPGEAGQHRRDTSASQEHGPDDATEGRPDSPGPPADVPGAVGPPAGVPGADAASAAHA